MVTEEWNPAVRARKLDPAPVTKKPRTCQC